MEKTLLVIANLDIRQLYHELLFSRNIEIVPIDSIANVIMMLALDCYDAAVIWGDESSLEMKTFLKLRKKHKSWLRTKIILLTAEGNLYRLLLSDKDIIINPHDLTPEEIATKIKAFINLHSKQL